MNLPVRYIPQIEKNGAIELLDVSILDGIFNADASRDPILQLLLDLRNFHQKRNFSHQERFGRPDPWSETMQTRLSAAITTARQMIDDAKNRNMPLILKSSFKVELLKG